MITFRFNHGRITNHECPFINTISIYCSRRARPTWLNTLSSCAWVLLYHLFCHQLACFNFVTIWWGFLYNIQENVKTLNTYLKGITWVNNFRVKVCLILYTKTCKIMGKLYITYHFKYVFLYLLKVMVFSRFLLIHVSIDHACSASSIFELLCRITFRDVCFHLIITVTYFTKLRIFYSKWTLTVDANYSIKLSIHCYTTFWNVIVECFLLLFAM